MLDNYLRRDATRTIPVPRSLSKDIAGTALPLVNYFSAMIRFLPNWPGACSSGAEIHIQERQPILLCSGVCLCNSVINHRELCK